MKKVLIFISLLLTFVNVTGQNQINVVKAYVRDWIIYKGDTLAVTAVAHAAAWDTLFVTKGSVLDTVIVSRVRELDNLSDVTLTTPDASDMLILDDETMKWVNRPLIQVYDDMQDTLKNAGRGEAVPDPDSIYYAIIDTTYYNIDSNSVTSFRTPNSYLPNWRKDFANAFYPYITTGNDNCKLAIIGDSYASGASNYFTVDAQQLYGRGGGFQPFLSVGVVGDENYCQKDTNWTFGTDANDTLILTSAYAESSTIGATIQLSAPYFNKLRIFYRQISGGGTFSYQLGASGTATNISTDGATDAKWCYKNFAALKGRPNDTVFIKVVSGSVRLYGYYFQNDYSPEIFAEPHQKLEIHNLTNGGTSAQDFTGKNITAVNTLIDTLDASAAIILFLDEYTYSPFTEIPTLINEIRAAKSTTDILLLSPYNNNTNLGREQSKKYRKLAQNIGVGYLDLSNQTGSYNDNNSAGLMADVTHFNWFGFEAIYHSIFHVLFTPNNYTYDANSFQVTVHGNSLIFPNSNNLYVTSKNKNTSLGTNNSSLGYSSMASNTTGYQNVAVGSGSLEKNTTGALNIAIGYKSLYANTTGTDNTAIGLKAVSTATTAQGNTGIGSLALEKTTGQLNTAVGYSSLPVNSSGVNNTALGAASLLTNTTGVNNVAVGFSALRLNSTGNNNLGLGYEAGRGVLGSNNICIGYRAGYKETGSSKFYFASDSTSWANGMASGSKLLMYADQSNAAKSNHFLNIFAKVSIGAAKDPNEMLSVTGNASITGYLKTGTGSIADNDSTPSVASYNTFIYAGSANPVSIDALDDHVVGCYYTIIGNSNTYTITVIDGTPAGGDSFNLAGGNWVGGSQDVLLLYCIAADAFVEVSRSDN